MSFYSVWYQFVCDELDDDSFMKAFLSKAEISQVPLMTGSSEDIRIIEQVLSAIPINDFLNYIKNDSRDYHVTSYDIPCYSNFFDGIERVNELLEFPPYQMDLKELGFALVKSKSDTARIKYGENHAKLAAMASLIYFSNTRPTIVESSAIGKYLVAYSFDKKSDLLKKLLLRDIFVQKFIHCILNGQTLYSEQVEFLKQSTAERRRSNTKTLINFVLKDTEHEELLSQIKWEI